MTKDYRVADKTEPTQTRNRNNLVHNFVERVDLKINDVSSNEIQKLSTLIYSLKNPQYKDQVIDNGNGKQAFVVTVKPARLDEIKQALHVVLRCVEGDRIAIDT